MSELRKCGTISLRERVVAHKIEQLRPTRLHERGRECPAARSAKFAQCAQDVGEIANKLIAVATKSVTPKDDCGQPRHAALNRVVLQ